MTETAEYEITERAGSRVAGRVVVKGVTTTLTLTAAEAEHPLAEGTIVPKDKALHKSFTEGTKRLDGMRAEAAALRARTAMPPSVPDEPETVDGPAVPVEAPKDQPRAKAGAASADALKDA